MTDRDAELLQDDVELRAGQDVQFVLREEIDQPFLSNHLDLVANTKDFIRDLGNNFRADLEERALEFSRKVGLPAQKATIEYAINRGLLSPEFEIYGPQAAAKFLEDELGWYQDIGEDNLVIVFRLPKPIDYYWDRGGDRNGGFNEITPSTSSLWGDSYDELISSVWDFWDRSVENYGLNLYRLNDVGEHSKGGYYYIWEVEKA